jgi:hypothetical protein
MASFNGPGAAPEAGAAAEKRRKIREANMKS